MIRTFPLAAAAALLILAPIRAADAGCTVVGLEGQTLTAEEIAPGEWQTAADAADETLRKAKVAGDLFSRVFLGGYMRQEVQRSLDANDEEYASAQAALLAASAPFSGTCAGEILDEVGRKAEGYRAPERAMVVNALKGKPIQASQKNIHDGRSMDLREFERRWRQIRDGVEILGVSVVQETLVQLGSLRGLKITLGCAGADCCQ